MQEHRAELRPRSTEGKTQLEQDSGVKSGKITPARGVARGWEPPRPRGAGPDGVIVGNQAVWIPRRGLGACRTKCRTGTSIVSEAGRSGIKSLPNQRC